MNRITHDTNKLRTNELVDLPTAAALALDHAGFRPFSLIKRGATASALTLCWDVNKDKSLIGTLELWIENRYEMELRDRTAPKRFHLIVAGTDAVIFAYVENERGIPSWLPAYLIRLP